jgi:hypothetical protein
MSDEFPPRTAEDRERARQERERRRAEKSRAEVDQKPSDAAGQTPGAASTAGQPAIQRPEPAPVPSWPPSTSRTASRPPDRTVDDAATAGHVLASWQAAQRAPVPDATRIEKALHKAPGWPPARAPVAPTPEAPAPGAAAGESRPDRDEVRRRATDLIGAYQQTLSEMKARKLQDEATVLVKHVIAESCDKAAAEAERLRRPVTAKELRNFRATFSDPLGWALKKARDQAVDQVRETAADLPGKITTLKAALIAWTGWVIAAAAGLVAFGAALVQHPGSIRIVGAVAVAGAGAGAWFEKEFAEARQDFKDALAVADPIAPLLAQTLDSREASYFAAVGSSRPSRHKLALAGPAYAGLLGACTAIAVICALLILIGAIAAIASFLSQLAESASQSTG